jgi:hypothetical protein
MSGSRQQALVDARKLVRTFASAPDARRRAQEVLAELKRADDWSGAGWKQIEAVDAWLQSKPSVSALEPRLRALLSGLSEGP